MKCRLAPGSAALALLSDARGLSQTESQPWTTVDALPFLRDCGRTQSVTRPRPGIEPPTV